MSHSYIYKVEQRLQRAEKTLEGAAYEREYYAILCERDAFLADKWCIRAVQSAPLCGECSGYLTHECEELVDECDLEIGVFTLVQACAIIPTLHYDACTLVSCELVRASELLACGR